MDKSIMAQKLSEHFRRMPKMSETKAEAEIETLRQRGEISPTLPKRLPARLVEGIIIVNERSRSGIDVYYLHGGGYEHGFSPYHWKFLKEIANRTDARIFAPAYRQIPFGTCQDAMDWIAPLIEAHAKANPNNKLVLMGDSAGGGLALALAERLFHAGQRLPDELILISPWVDVTLDNPQISKYSQRDPWLSVPWLKVCGRHWAGEYDLRDWRVSPVYGEVSGLNPVTVIAGTEEVLYPDIIQLYKKLAPGSVELLVGEGMNHAFPLLPIPEAAAAIERICEILLRRQIPRIPVPVPPRSLSLYGAH